VAVRFQLPEYPEASAFPAFSADFAVTVNDALNLELKITNNSKDEILNLSRTACTLLRGGRLSPPSQFPASKGVDYLDKTANFCRKKRRPTIPFASLPKWTGFISTPLVRWKSSTPRLKRTIRVEKHGSLRRSSGTRGSPNPQQMPDFGNDEYQRMVCVESG